MIPSAPATVRRRLLILNLYMVHPPDTGAKLVIWNRIVELSRRFEVTFCCLVEAHKAVPAASLAAVREHARLLHVEPAPRRGPLSVAVDSVFQPAVRLFAEPVRTWLHGDEVGSLRAEDFDLVEVHSSCWHRRELAALSGLKVLVAHNDEAEYWRAQADAVARSAGLRERLGARLDAFQAARQQRAAIGASDAIVALSGRDERRLRSLAPGKPTLVNRGGIDCHAYDEVAAHGPGDPSRLVYVATFVDAAAESAVRFADEALPRLRERHPSIRLRLVGDDRGHPGLQRLRDRPEVEITGRVQDVRPELQRAGIVVVPTTAGSGVRLKIMEACAAGKAIVTTQKGVDGLGLIDGEHAAVTPDVPSMAEAIEQLLGNDRLRNRLGASARELALRDFDRGRCCSDLADWYDGLLESGGGDQPEA